MSELELQALCREWQKSLHLEDWSITLQAVPNDVLDPLLGDIQYPNRTARIRLAQDADVEFDHEIILVHELLHIHFSDFERLGLIDADEGRTSNRAFECSITQLAKAMVGTKRKRAQRKS